MILGIGPFGTGTINDFYLSHDNPIGQSHFSDQTLTEYRSTSNVDHNEYSTTLGARFRGRYYFEEADRSSYPFLDYDLIWRLQ